MEILLEGLAEAGRLIFSFDGMVMRAAGRSLYITSIAILFAAMIGLPLGILLARRNFAGRGLAIGISRAGMAVPTVFVGLVCFSLFSRRGPMGALDLLYTPGAIIVGEVLLALPIIVSLSHGAVKSLDPRIAETAKMLGATTWRRIRTYLSEARVGVTLAILTAFGRCFTELGIAMMVGGNIKERTRTLATATALETGKGEFGRGLAMGLLLLLMALAVTGILVWLSREKSNE